MKGLEKHIDRKTFLKQGPLVLMGAFFEGIHGGASKAAVESTSPLRPPGAAPENEFLDMCCGVGACAEACPAEAIQLRPRSGDEAAVAPVIVPSEAACQVCEELACMKACPSGALTPVSKEEIRIGLAAVERERCLAWLGMDPSCDYCADRCPLGVSAIRMIREEGSRGPAIEAGCVGCGLCEYFCPASPSAVRVEPLDRL